MVNEMTDTDCDSAGDKNLLGRVASDYDATTLTDIVLGRIQQHPDITAKSQLAVMDGYGQTHGLFSFEKKDHKNNISSFVYVDSCGDKRAEAKAFYPLAKMTKIIKQLGDTKKLTSNRVIFSYIEAYWTGVQHTVTIDVNLANKTARYIDPCSSNKQLFHGVMGFVHGSNSLQDAEAALATLGVEYVIPEYLGIQDKEGPCGPFAGQVIKKLIYDEPMLDFETDRSIRIQDDDILETTLTAQKQRKQEIIKLKQKIGKANQDSSSSSELDLSQTTESRESDSSISDLSFLAAGGLSDGSESDMFFSRSEDDFSLDAPLPASSGPNFSDSASRATALKKPLQFKSTEPVMVDETNYVYDLSTKQILSEHIFQSELLKPACLPYLVTPLMALGRFSWFSLQLLLSELQTLILLIGLALVIPTAAVLSYAVAALTAILTPVIAPVVVVGSVAATVGATVAAGAMAGMKGASTYPKMTAGLLTATLGLGAGIAVLTGLALLTTLALPIAISIAGASAIAVGGLVGYGLFKVANKYNQQMKAPELLENASSNNLS